MKVELAAPSPTPGGDGMRKRRGQAAPSSGRGSARGNSGLISSGGGDTRQLCESLVVIPGSLGTLGDVAFETVEQDSNVKLELGVCRPSPLTSDTW